MCLSAGQKKVKSEYWQFSPSDKLIQLLVCLTVPQSRVPDQKSIREPKITFSADAAKRFLKYVLFKGEFYRLLVGCIESFVFSCFAHNQVMTWRQVVNLEWCHGLLKSSLYYPSFTQLWSACNVFVLAMFVLFFFYCCTCLV